MPDKGTRVYLEVGSKKVFACVADWPGWCRSGGDEGAALAALADYADRYADVVGAARMRWPGSKVTAFDVVERVKGSGTTDFGAPGAVPDLDGEPLTAREARRQVQLLEASWELLAREAARAPSSLRKGPRGGGRDRDPMVEHVVQAEAAYARKIGIKHQPPDPGDSAAVSALRRDVVEALRAARDGGPMAVKGWPARYAARRFAWHALDHLWEMQDRSDG